MNNKKAAMFGKLSQLDHIMSLRGELIARSRGNLFNNAKTAAMFGLDARIALAIFGALSVITGAALFSAIGNAKTVSILTEMQELGKAYEAYFLDTGSHMPIASGHARDLEIDRLIDKPTDVTNWNGPYLSSTVKDECHLNALKDVTSEMMFVVMKQDWGAQPNFEAGNTLSCAAGGKDCSVWSILRVPLTSNLAQKLDLYVDGSAGASVGKLRYVDTAGHHYIAYNTGVQYPR